jgi:hypothetical protein
VISLSEVQRVLHRLYIGAPGTTLRREERQKAAEIAALLPELGRAIGRVSTARALTLVDASAGKGYVGLLASALVLAPARRRARVVLIEREEERLAAARAAAEALGAPEIDVDARQGDVADPLVWPEQPSIVVALHACGRASDDVIDAAVRACARQVLCVPCCTGVDVLAERDALAAAAALGIPEHGAVRRSFAESWIAAERTLRLEAAGYETEVVAFVAPTVTPYNLLWRARRVREPARMEAARARRERLARFAARFPDDG